MKKVSAFIFAALAAIFAAALTVMLAGSLINSFRPMPTEYPDTVWLSDDGRFTLYVHSFDEELQECPAELIYESDQGSVSFDVNDVSRGALKISSGGQTVDNWLRTECSADGFTVRINRMGAPAYGSAYAPDEKISFKREK